MIGTFGGQFELSTSLFKITTVQTTPGRQDYSGLHKNTPERQDYTGQASPHRQTADLDCNQSDY